MKTPAEDQPESPLVTGAGAPSAQADEGILWLVSFSEEDDRELRPPDIAEALRRGEIDDETIVWRDGLEDWAPLGSIPSLARLLAATGETANAPLVVPTQASRAAAASTRPLSVRTKGNEPAKPSMKPLADLSPTKTIVIADDPPKAAASPALPSPTTPDPQPTAPDVKSAEPWRGKTRLGLPKAPAPKPTLAVQPSDPEEGDTKTAPIARALPPGAKALTPQTPKAKALTPDAPKVARTPDAPKAAVGRTPTASKAEVAPASSKRGPTSIWDDDENEPVSVNPESIRPLSPTPGMANATALSRGTLGMPNKPPPPAPRPPGAKTPAPTPAAPVAADRKLSRAETPPIASLAGVRPPARRRDEDIMNLGGGGGMSGGMLAPPAFDLVAAFGDEPTFSAERPPLDAPDVPAVDEETKTVPKATAEAKRPAAASASESTANAKAEPAKKRSPVPLVLGGVAIAVALFIGTRKPGGTEPAEPSPVAVQETERTEEPRPAAVPREPPPIEPTPPTAEPVPPVASPTTTVHAASTSPLVGSHAIAKTGAPGSISKEPKPAAEKKAGAEKKVEPPPPPEPEPKQVDMGGEFDKSAASAALGAATSQAAGCRKEGDPTGVAVVHVTFSNSGRASRATIEGPPFAGTATGGCIAAALRGAKVPPFGGDRVTVTKRVVIQ